MTDLKEVSKNKQALFDSLNTSFNIGLVAFSNIGFIFMNSIFAQFYSKESYEIKWSSKQK